MKRPAPKARRRGSIELLLKKFQATDPATLDAEARRYRALAIRALEIELKLRSEGWTVGQDGWAVPAASGSEDSSSRPPQRQPPSRTPRARRS